jgi:type IV pilus assembly protein PilC
LRDRFYVRCPGVRYFAKTSIVAGFSRVFGTMLQAGVPLDETLQAVHDTSSNELVRHTLTRVQEAVAAGGRITPVLEKSGMFPAVAYDLTAIGEEAGALDRVFSRMADIYEEKLSTDVAALGKFVQPVVVILLGLIVGFVVIAMFSTYSSVVQQIQI